ncbi:hypothetical protein BT96DRAFT_1016732 [Gymnopus androsaceus JB14]|uniref:Uncharacterized protein n=1 Tax=Gymnopus androsaceus JB14 TaxID=1447944 RepID=A0A6A4I559_9AGAR|nr:hypothetical protein BT96DRAFT_1016732 [Gymnopus androsaceus JB14]
MFSYFYRLINHLINHHLKSEQSARPRDLEKDIDFLEVECDTTLEKIRADAEEMWRAKINDSTIIIAFILTLTVFTIPKTLVNMELSWAKAVVLCIDGITGMFIASQYSVIKANSNLSKATTNLDAGLVALRAAQEKGDFNKSEIETVRTAVEPVLGVYDQASAMSTMIAGRWKVIRTLLSPYDLVYNNSLDSLIDQEKKNLDNRLERVKGRVDRKELEKVKKDLEHAKAELGQATERIQELEKKLQAQKDILTELEVVLQRCQA